MYGLIWMNYGNINNNLHAFIKLTYAEGKKIWARRVVYRNPLTNGYVQFDSTSDIMGDPFNSGYFTIGLTLAANTG